MSENSFITKITSMDAEVWTEEENVSFCQFECSGLDSGQENFNHQDSYAGVYRNLHDNCILNVSIHRLHSFWYIVKNTPLVFNCVSTNTYLNGHQIRLMWRSPTTVHESLLFLLLKGMTKRSFAGKFCLRLNTFKQQLNLPKTFAWFCEKQVRRKCLRVTSYQFWPVFLLESLKRSASPQSWCNV